MSGTGTARGIPTGADYWTIVFKQFRRRRLAVAALWGVALLFLLAIFAPLLASDRPLFMNDGSVTSFPAFAGLARADYVWLAGLVAALAGRLAYGHFKKKRPESPELVRAVALSLAVMLTCSLLAFALVRPMGDRTNWKSVTRAAREAGGRVVSAPVPHSPYSTRLTLRLKPPGHQGHLLGTDAAGRDILSRMIWGTRVSLIVGFVAVSIYVTIGVLMGSVAGFFGGRIDMAICRLIEVVMCFPSFFLILSVLAFLPPSIFNIMVLIGVTGWTGVARLTRGEMLRLKGSDFVSAGQALGASSPRLIFRHLLPNSLAPVLVAATFGVAAAILVEAALSFLGFGVPPPTASWGSILYDARPFVSTHPWLPLYPGLAIFFTVTAYNLVGEGVRDAIDPRLTQ